MMVAEAEEVTDQLRTQVLARCWRTELGYGLHAQWKLRC